MYGMKLVKDHIFVDVKFTLKTFLYAAKLKTISSRLSSLQLTEESKFESKFLALMRLQKFLSFNFMFCFA